MSAIDTTRVWDTLMVGPLQVEHLLPGDDSGDSWVTADRDLFQALVLAGCPLLKTGLRQPMDVIADIAVQDGHVVAHDGRRAHDLDGTPCADLVLAWLEANGDYPDA